MSILSVGIERGKELGMELGRAEGRAEGRAAGILDLLSDLGPVPEELRKKIMSEKNLDILKEWNKKAARAASVDEFSGSL